jgi:hypothetical protein
MKYALSIAVLLLATSPVQPSFAQGNAGDLVKQAVAAEGGAAALRTRAGPLLVPRGRGRIASSALGYDR